MYIYIEISYKNLLFHDIQFFWDAPIFINIIQIHVRTHLKEVPCCMKKHGETEQQRECIAIFDHMMKYSLSSSWWNSFHIFSLLLSHILHLLQPLLCLWKMGFCLKVSSCHTCPHDNNLITKDLGQMPLLPHKQMYTHTNTYTCFEKHLVERLCTVIRNWLKVCCSVLCVCVTVDASVCVWVHLIGCNLSRTDLFRHTGRYHLPCKWADERVTVQRSSRMNYFRKRPIDFTDTLHVLPTIKFCPECVNWKVLGNYLET